MYYTFSGIIYRNQYESIVSQWDYDILVEDPRSKQRGMRSLGFNLDLLFTLSFFLLT